MCLKFEQCPPKLWWHTNCCRIYATVGVGNYLPLKWLTK